LTAADLNLMRRRDHQARTRIVSSRARSITTIDGQVMLQPASVGIKWAFVTETTPPSPLMPQFPFGKVMAREALLQGNGTWKLVGMPSEYRPAPNYTWEHYRYFVLGAREDPPLEEPPERPSDRDAVCLIIGTILLPDFRMLLVPPPLLAELCPICEP
jgi:hypothetical protein